MISLFGGLSGEVVFRQMRCIVSRKNYLLLILTVFDFLLLPELRLICY